MGYYGNWFCSTVYRTVDDTRRNTSVGGGTKCPVRLLWNVTFYNFLRLQPVENRKNLWKTPSFGKTFAVIPVEKTLNWAEKRGISWGRIGKTLLVHLNLWETRPSFPHVFHRQNTFKVWERVFFWFFPQFPHPLLLLFKFLIELGVF